MKLPRRAFLHLAAGAAALPAILRFAEAQAYPSRPVRFVVPFVAGGGVDFIARLVGEHVSSTIGQPIIIENKAGAGGLLGIESAAKSSPDGYTVLICNDSLASAPHTVKFNVDYIATLQPIIQLTRAAVVIVVHPQLGVKSIADLIDAAKRRPGIAYASSGVGTQQHFVMEWIARLRELNLITSHIGVPARL
jgi:tripartite-type tricarboxylate transporter receptor subunit TctC